MPYKNVPEEMIPDMDSCVEKVMAGDSSLDKDSAIAICYTSVVEGKALSPKPTASWVAKAGQFISSKLLRGSKGEYVSTRLKGGMLRMYKDSGGNWRWVLLSSNSMEDLDGEIISQKALERDIARADREKDYGPLRWWHVTGMDLGDCDFNAMHGRILIESGTFHQKEVGAAIAVAADQLGASIGFYHPVSEPDSEGVYYNIRRYERSLLPREEAANPYTMLLVEQEKETMQKDKETALRDLLKDVDPLVVDGLIATASAVEEKALVAGVRHKEAAIEPPEVDPPVVPVDPPATPPEDPAAEAHKEVSKEEQVQKVRDAVCALNPAYGTSMPGSYWVYAETVFDDHVIVNTGEKIFDIPYTQDDKGVVAISAPMDWAEVERKWVPVGKEAAPPPTEEPPKPIEKPSTDSVLMGSLVVQKAMSILVKEEADAEKLPEPALMPPPVSAKPPMAAEAIPSKEEVKQPDVPPEKIAVSPPPPVAAAPAGEPALSESTPVGNLTLGQLGEIIATVVTEAMGQMRQEEGKKISALEGVLGTGTKERGEIKAAMLVYDKVQKDIVLALKQLVGDAPEITARKARASMSDSTLLDEQPEEVRQAVKEGERILTPRADSGLDKAMNAITAAAGGGSVFVIPGGAPQT